MLTRNILIIAIFCSSFSEAQIEKIKNTSKENELINKKSETKMKVEVWSDVMCPFCYIGKRKFEAALAKFENKDNIELEWKSFQLDPSIEAGPKDYNQYLSERKGFPLSQVKQLLDNVKDMAGNAGLDFHLEKAVIANSFDAHRLSHLAKEKGLQDQIEELLFKAHFIEGKDISDHNTLVELAVKAGINKEDAEEILSSDKFSAEVKNDITEAQKIGVQGVPFFVFDRKYAVSGAQDTKVFSDVIEKSFNEWQKNNPSKIEVIQGKVCTPEGECK